MRRLSGRLAVLAILTAAGVLASACREPFPEPRADALRYPLELRGHGFVGEARLEVGDELIEAIEFAFPDGPKHRLRLQADSKQLPNVRSERVVGRERTRVDLVRGADGTVEWVRRKGLGIERVSITSADIDGFVIEPKLPQETDLGSLAPFVLFARQASAGEGRAQRVERTVVQLRDGRPAPLRAELRERRRVVVAGEPVEATRWFVQTPASGHSVWIDETGRLLGVDQLFGGLRAVLADVEWPETARTPPPDEVHEEEVEVGTPSAALSGSLSKPRDATRPLPGVVLIHGSGPTDRDMAPSFFLRDLAYGLSRHGFAVVRYDKRGVGKSRITDPSAALTMDVFADDAAAWLDVLASRSDVDGACLIPIGHSEGASFSPMLAVRDSRVAAVVTVAGGPDNLGAVLPDQLELISHAHDVGPKEVEVLRRTQTASFRSLTSPTFSADRLPEDGRAAALWMKSHLEHDALGVMRLLNVPILALYAGGDLQVPVTQAERMRELLPSLPDGSDAVVFDGLDHLMMDHNGMPGLGAMLDPDRRLDSRIVPELVRWLRTVPCVAGD